MVDFLRDFIHILRSSDLRVSTSESIDAMNVVSEIGLEDRSLLKHSLSIISVFRKKFLIRSALFIIFYIYFKMKISLSNLPNILKNLT